MLGLGDLVLPGLIVAFAARYDVSIGRGGALARRAIKRVRGAARMRAVLAHPYYRLMVDRLRGRAHDGEHRGVRDADGPARAAVPRRARSAAERHRRPRGRAGHEPRPAPRSRAWRARRPRSIGATRGSRGAGDVENQGCSEARRPWMDHRASCPISTSHGEDDSRHHFRRRQQPDEPRGALVPGGRDTRRTTAATGGSCGARPRSTALPAGASSLCSVRHVEVVAGRRRELQSRRGTAHRAAAEARPKRVLSSCA